MKVFLRHGDVNLHEITKKEFENIQGEIIENEGSYILAKGEATGSVHLLEVKDKNNLIIKKDSEGRMYFALSDIATITHTHDHETLKTPKKKVYFVQIQEREMDHFANSLVRKVVD